jgi:CheY-like chemotaxis protein
LHDDKPVDLLLTDIVMPGLNGRELGKRAQAMRPGLPVLYMTGYSRNTIVHQGRLDEGVELLRRNWRRAFVRCLIAPEPSMIKAGPNTTKEAGHSVHRGRRSGSKTLLNEPIYFRLM